MLRQRRQPHLADLARASVDGSGVIHDPIVALGLELRAADVDHQVIRSGLSRLLEIEQIAGTQGCRFASDLSRVQSDQGPGVGELRVLRRRCRGDAKEWPARGGGTRRAERTSANCGVNGRPEGANPFRRVRAQRFTKRMADQRRAVVTSGVCRSNCASARRTNQARKAARSNSSARRTWAGRAATAGQSASADGGSGRGSLTCSLTANPAHRPATQRSRKSSAVHAWTTASAIGSRSPVPPRDRSSGRSMTLPWPSVCGVTP